MSEDRNGTASTADEWSAPTRTATIRTIHADAAVVAAALAPDNTESMSVSVDGDAIAARIERPTIGGLRSTVDDYVVNLRVADRMVASADGVLKPTASANTDDTTNTNT